MSGTDKKPTDWQLVEIDYRAGIKSLRQIGAENGCTEGAIRKRAKRDGWERDLSAKIKEQAASLVRKEAVRNEVRNSEAYQASEREIVDANAQMQADLLLAHRSDIRRSRTLSMALLDELESVTGNRELFERLGDLLRSEDDKGIDKLNDLYHKVISMPSRVDSMKKLAETLKVLIALEREAFGVDEKKSVAQTLEQFLDGLED